MYVVCIGSNMYECRLEEGRKERVPPYARSFRHRRSDVRPGAEHPGESNLLRREIYFLFMHGVLCMVYGLKMSDENVR